MTAGSRPKTTEPKQQARSLRTQQRAEKNYLERSTHEHQPGMNIPTSILQPPTPNHTAQEKMVECSLERR